MLPLRLKRVGQLTYHFSQTGKSKADPSQTVCRGCCCSGTRGVKSKVVILWHPELEMAAVEGFAGGAI